MTRFLIVPAALVLASCQPSILTAPQGTAITFTSATTVAANGTLNIIVNVNQGGTATGTGANATTPSGLPVHDGTVVDFATTLGTITPTEAKTVDGKVQVQLSPNGATGSAKIVASSGSVTGSTTITISASTTGISISLPGSSGVVSTPANFTVSSGPTAVNSVLVDFGDGQTQSLGSLAANATGTATNLYASAGTYQVNVSATGTDGSSATSSTNVAIAPLTLTPSGPSSIAAGSTGSYTITPTTGAFIDSYQWDFGDGTIVSTASNTQTHVYASSGTKTITVTVTPSKGSPRTVTIQVQVN